MSDVKATSRESIRVGTTTLRLIRGDITQQDTEAIVNAANSTLLGGGGVDGAIHRAGGPEVLAECKKIRQQHGECLPGQAVITGGGQLNARYVIHAVGPIWKGGKNNEDATLADAYRNSLGLAIRHRVKSIAFPSISTGAYRFPIEKASRIAVQTITGFVRENPGISEVRLIVFSLSDYDVYRETLSEPLS